MSVVVRLPAVLQRVAGGAKVVEVPGATVRDLLDSMDQRFPGFRERLLTDEGQLRRFVNVYLNNEDIRFLGDLDAELADGDVVSILPAMTGGR